MLQRMRLILLFFLMMGAFSSLQAQRDESFALIDTEYILGKLPEYKSALQSIEQSSKTWRERVRQLNEQAKELYIDYQKTRDTLSQKERVVKEEAIVSLEEQAKKEQLFYFGPKGELIKLQERLIKPLQEKIYDAVKLLSQRRGYKIVFDRAITQNSIIYADPLADISNDVLAVISK